MGDTPEQDPTTVAGQAKAPDDAAAWARTMHGRGIDEEEVRRFNEMERANRPRRDGAELQRAAERVGERIKEEPCTRPPAGWECSREPGHDGPCAAYPRVAKKNTPFREPAGETARPRRRFRSAIASLVIRLGDTPGRWPKASVSETVPGSRGPLALDPRLENALRDQLAYGLAPIHPEHDLGDATPEQRMRRALGHIQSILNDRGRSA